VNAEELLRRAALLVDSVPGKRPLIYHITNDVTIQLSANATLALGGAPVMSSSPRESADITSLSDALVINIGTPGRNSVKAMSRACRRASAEGIPAILDPVGAGFTAYRNRIVRSLISTGAFSIIKGNASEMAWLAGLGEGARGVDARPEKHPPQDIASRCAIRYRTVCVVTGPADFISDGELLFRVEGGSPLAGSMTGSGCLAATLCGLYLACSPSPLEAAAAALLTLRRGAVWGEKSAEGTASFQAGLLDAFTRIKGEEILREGILHEA